jgi:hypothetical protein
MVSSTRQSTGVCLSEALPSKVAQYGKRIRRGGYIFITWKSDHPPAHVHVYRDGRLVVKWDLENDVPMKGSAPAAVLRLIHALREEGLL